MSDPSATDLRDPDQRIGIMRRIVTLKLIIAEPCLTTSIQLKVSLNLTKCFVDVVGSVVLGINYE